MQGIWHHPNTSLCQNRFFLETLFNATNIGKYWDLQIPAVQHQSARLFIHMFTYYHKYPTGHSAQRDYSGLNLSWHRNEQGSQWLRWLKMDSVDGTCSTNKKTNCMPLGSIMNWWHHLSPCLHGVMVSITQDNCHIWWLIKSYEQDKDTFMFLTTYVIYSVLDSPSPYRYTHNKFSLYSMFISHATRIENMTTHHSL